MAPLRIGTRQSRLALWQTQWAVDRLQAADPDLAIELVPMKTVADRAPDLPLARIGDKGLFVKDLELALLDGTIDLAVHSLKDLPSVLTPGLWIAAIGPREDPRDVLVSPSGARLAELPAGARVGTSSARRIAQVLAFRRDLTVVPLRGNVETRLAKVRRGDCEAAVLAAAGLLRLDRAAEITEYLDPDICLPAPGQGMIACEVAAQNESLVERLAAIDDRPAHLASLAERAFTARLTGGCQIPVAAYAEVAEPEIRLRALVADPAGRTVLCGVATGSADRPQEIGCRLADELLDRGAADLLRRAGAAT